MAYSTLPLAVDGNVLSATYLNTIRDDLEYFYGLGSTANVPFVTPPFADEPWTYQIRHRARYLNIYGSWDVPAEPDYYIYVNYNGLQVGAFDLVALFGTGVGSGYITADLDAAPGPFTYGEWFPILINVDKSGLGEFFFPNRVYESNTDESV